WASWLEYSFSRRSSCPSSPCLQASACCMIDSLYSGVNTRRVRFSSSGFGSTLGSTGVAGLGILLLLTALICMLSQISVAQGYVDTQGLHAQHSIKWDSR